MKKHLLTIAAAAAALCALTACGTTVPLTMTKEESALINGSPEVMRILSIDNAQDLAVLRKESRNFNVVDINTPEYQTLVRKMAATLESCGEDAVGLAAPQIGINRRVVAVRRVDKEGAPIEVYPNIWIEETRGEKEAGPEGCLSVPDKRGDVLRYRDITIRYTDVNSDRLDQPREISEAVKGFAAVIFQHELDHLDGVLFIDKISE